MINRRDTAKNMALLAAINRGEMVNLGQTKAPVVSNNTTVMNVSAMDSKSFREFALSNQGVFAEMYVRDMRMAGSTRSAGRTYR